MTTRALILAAGLGSRLQHVTQHQPKALTPVGGKPILQYQIEALRNQSVSSIGIVLGYHGEQIQAFMQSTFPDLTVHYFWNPDFATTNSAVSFWQARDWIASDAYMHINCDVLFTPALLGAMIRAPHENVIAVRRDIALTDGMENVVLDNERICEMSLVTHARAMGKAFGLAKLSPQNHRWVIPRIADDLAAGKMQQNYFGMLRLAVEALPYHAMVTTHAQLMEVNTLQDLTVAETQLVQQPW